MTSKFKVGDEVYFLIEENGWGSAPVEIGNIRIRKEKIKDILDFDYGWGDLSYLIEATNIEGVFDDENAFATKDDLINFLNLMIKELSASDHDHFGNKFSDKVIHDFSPKKQ